MRVRSHLRAVVPLGVAVSISLSGVTACATVAGVHAVPAAAATSAPLSPERAEQIAARVMTAAATARTAKPAQAKALRAAAMTGSALAVATAADQLGTTTAAAPQPVTRTPQPRVLAISRGTGWPRVIVVQTTDDTGASVLNLLTSPDAKTPFKLSASATMHAGATVPALDPLSVGSPLVGPGSGLAVDPQDLVSEYAASLAFPKKTPAAQIDTTDPFSTGVRANAAAQLKAFGGLASLTQTHHPQPDRTVAIGLRGGGALVFALLERTDAITLKPGGKSLTPSPAFQKLVHKKTLSSSAELKSYETVVFTIPAQGQATVVAVDETLFSAKGA
ncbi:hypothetical protein [Nostocoides sp. HKS02]|uniref:hypothetical protein n=1 Tax=Nostocoides sp. HKS02 TaxID=1813880 RepID=UPI0012B478C6|nr:hypothetical protein [Tetrasphaera sp. HKS02]QGN56776.1 hypothetical protein GKE56_01370 [Tetrasphaera sp. HKS02]